MRGTASGLRTFGFGLLMAMGVSSAAGAQRQPQIEFFQADTQFDGQLVLNSGFGLARVVHDGTPEIVYLNVSVNNTWQIENIPLMSPNGVGVLHEKFLAFDLGVPHGQDVPFINYGWAVTPQVLAEMPPSQLQAPLPSFLYSIDSGNQGVVLFCGDPVPLRGGIAKEKRPRPPALPPPNQPCGPKECVPAAVSNALKALNEMLPPRRRVPEERLTIAALKPALEWNIDAGGCDGARWPDLKKAHVERIGMPVTTEVVPPSSDRNEMAAIMKKLVQARKRNCMIEMTVEGHCVLVNSIAEVENRNDFTFEVLHDVGQRNSATTAIPQTVTYDPTTNKITGGWMMEGKSVIHFVIECIDRGNH